MRTVVREALFDQQLMSVFHASLLIAADEIIQDTVEWALSHANLSHYPLMGGTYNGHHVRMFISVPMGAMPAFAVLFFSPDQNHVHLLALGVFPTVSTLPAPPPPKRKLTK